jgi:PKD repeat protein
MRNGPGFGRGRIVATALCVVGAVAVTGCMGNATIRGVSASSEPSLGGQAVTFTGLPGGDEGCSKDAYMGEWTSEDQPDVSQDTRTVGGVWTFQHTFPVQAPGTRRDYKVTIAAVDIPRQRAANGAEIGTTPPLPSPCGDYQTTNYTHGVVGPPAQPGGPPTTPPPSTTTTPPPPAGPVASFSFVPAQPTVDNRVTFDGSSSTDSDGHIVRYDWRFGDQAYPQTATGQSVQATYQSAGTFAVTLTVTDDRGRTANATKSVTVTDPFAARAASRRVVKAGPGVFVSTSRHLRAGAVSYLFADLQRGVAPARSYAWDLDGDGRYGRETGNRVAAEVFGRPGLRKVGLRVRTADGRVHTSSATVAVAAASKIPKGVVAQPFTATLSSMTARDPGVHRLLLGLRKASRHKPDRALGDTGAFVLRARRRFRTGGDRLLAPLLHATSRGQARIDYGARTLTATYLLSSAAAKSRTCVAVSAAYSNRGAGGTLTVLGGTGAGARLHLRGTFGATADPSYRRATLGGMLYMRRGAPRPLPAACRALLPGRRG